MVLGVGGNMMLLNGLWTYGIYNNSFTTYNPHPHGRFKPAKPSGYAVYREYVMIHILL